MSLQGSLFISEQDIEYELTKIGFFLNSIFSFGLLVNYTDQYKMNAITDAVRKKFGLQIIIVKENQIFEDLIFNVLAIELNLENKVEEVESRLKMIIDKVIDQEKKIIVFKNRTTHPQLKDLKSRINSFEVLNI